MVKKKSEPEVVPDHILEWATMENLLAEVEVFVQQIRDDARADVAMGKPIENALALGRDARRQQGSQIDRGPRWPTLDAWIEAQLQARAWTTDDLFTQVEDEECTDFYRDGDVICLGSKKPLGLSGFAKRVTEARRRIAERR